MTFEVSQSKLNTWRSCRNQYHYKYVAKLTRKNKPYPFMRGTIIHDMLEAHYKKKDPWKPYKEAVEQHSKLFRVEREEYGDLPTDLRNLMVGYFEFYKKDTLQVLEVEREFRVKLKSDIFLVGKMDLIAKTQGLKWLTEHKCHNVIPSGSTVSYTNLQSSLYEWAYNKETGKSVDGILWNYLLGKPASKPKLLKDGSMSRRQLTTTWPIYRQALKDAKLEPSDYLDVKKSLVGMENTFYQRKFLPTNQQMTKSIVEDTIITATEIQKAAGKDRTRNLGRHCDFCEFKNLCLSELKGLDTDYMIKANFKVREKDVVSEVPVS